MKHKAADLASPTRTFPSLAVSRRTIKNHTWWPWGRERVCFVKLWASTLERPSWTNEQETKDKTRWLISWRTVAFVSEDPFIRSLTTFFAICYPAWARTRATSLWAKMDRAYVLHWPKNLFYNFLFHRIFLFNLETWKIIRNFKNDQGILINSHVL